MNTLELARLSLDGWGFKIRARCRNGVYTVSIRAKWGAHGVYITAVGANLESAADKAFAALDTVCFRQALGEARLFHLRRVHLDRGGYKRGGMYFGHGLPLYEFWDDILSCTGHVRAATREGAKEAVRREFPAAKFKR